LAAPAAWRANDVVVYDAMREASTTLTALLLHTSPSPSDAHAEVVQLRQDVLGVDAFDRGATAALANRIAARIDELTGRGR
jgi:hypothetical protein